MVLVPSPLEREGYQTMMVVSVDLENQIRDDNRHTLGI